jgi:hypothetical protein
MKLYTEEQINLAMRLMVEDRATFKQILELLTPIELPTDEDIEEYRNHPRNNEWCQYGIMVGAKWMREQVLGKEDKTFKQKSKWTNL